MKKELGQGESFVKWFSELSNKDVPIAGGKGASLAEMFNAKIPVPYGFIVTAQAYSYFLEKTNLNAKINAITSEININDTTELNKASKQIRGIIESSNLPKEIEEEIIEAYEILGAEKKQANVNEFLEKSGSEPFVAVRSSATTEDLADASFAGQQDSFLNVRGSRDLLDKVKKCISSLFTARAIYYRTKKGFKHEQAKLAVVIQKMVDSTKSGVIFSQNPTEENKGIVIEAVWGFGEGIVSGKIKPDHYVVSPDLENFEILETIVSTKKIAIVKNKEGKNFTINLDETTANKQVLSTYEIKILAQLARRLEEHYKKPQDIEFAISEEGIFIVQSRPITTVFKKAEVEISGKILLSGLGASPGIASGKVKIMHNLSELEKIKDGDVLVTEMTNPDMVVSMQKSVAIITDEGGVTSHAAIVSREMGIPAVVGTGNATKVLKDGDEVTVDGSAGRVYAGKGETKLVEVKPIVPTRTEIKVIVDLPEAAERAAKSMVRGIGLLRLEGIIAVSGKHPFYFVKQKDISAYVKLLSSGLKKISQHFKEIWIRTSDLRSDEYNELGGAPEHKEGNPMLGDHGIRFSLKHKDIMKAELLAIKEIAHSFPEKKFGVMMPQVISVEEVQETKRLAEEVHLPSNVAVGIMVETPAAVQIIEDLCREGISFASFGTNDLTQYTLAIDRNNEEVQSLFNEMHPAVLNSIKHVIKVCKKYRVSTSICGQAGSREEMARFLLEQGIDSISVNADAAYKISKIVAELEKNFIGNRDFEIINVGEPENEENHKEKITKNEEVVMMHEKVRTDSENIDIEESILRALDENNKDYVSSLQKDKKQEIPPLNEAIGVSPDLMNEDGEKSENDNGTTGLASLFNGLDGDDVEQKVEEELEKEVEFDLLGKKLRCGVK